MSFFKLRKVTLREVIDWISYPLKPGFSPCSCMSFILDRFQEENKLDDDQPLTNAWFYGCSVLHTILSTTSSPDSSCITAWFRYCEAESEPELELCTRGDVRRLFRVLKIPFTEPEKPNGSDAVKSTDVKYYTFIRSAKNFKDLAEAGKKVVEEGLTEEEAANNCADWNRERTEEQVAAGTKMEYAPEGWGSNIVREGNSSVQPH